MKRIFIFSIILLGSLHSFCQTLDDINDLVGKKNYAEAKTGIDKYLADKKNASSAEGWYFKGFVYNALSRETSTAKTDAYNYKLAAFDAFKKNQELDKLDLMLKGEQYSSYLDLYLGLYDIGAQQFNDKDYAAAYSSFNKAQDIENFILSKKYTYKEATLNKMDTGLVMNIAASALQAKDSLAAVANYRKITDANITGKDYEQVYEFLAGYYNGQKDEANLQALLTKAKAAYPKNNYWNEIEISKLAKSGDKAAILAHYDELYKADPKNFTNTYNYGVELYNSIYVNEPKNTDPAAKATLSEVLTATIQNDEGIDATLLMANHMFNWAADYSSGAALVKGAKPEDVKKKKDLNVLYNAKMDETIPVAEKVVKYYTDKPPTTVKEKLNYQQALGYLSDIYVAKANPKKAAEYDKMRDAIKF